MRIITWPTPSGPQPGVLSDISPVDLLRQIVATVPDQGSADVVFTQADDDTLVSLPDGKVICFRTADLR
jgi:hypothetical protein